MARKGESLVLDVKAINVTIEGERLRDLTLGEKEEVVIPDVPLKQYTLGNVVLEAGARLIFEMGSNDRGELQPTQLNADSFKADEKATFVLQFPPEYVLVHTAVDLALVTTDKLDAAKVLYILRLLNSPDSDFEPAFSTSTELESGRYFLKTNIRIRDKTKATTALLTTVLSTTTLTPATITSAALEPWWILGGAVLFVIVTGLVYCVIKRWREQPETNAAELKHPQPNADYGQLPARQSSNYAANAAEFKAGIAQEPNYDVIRDADNYAKNAAEFKAGISQEPNYSMIGD